MKKIIERAKKHVEGMFADLRGLTDPGDAEDYSACHCVASGLKENIERGDVASLKKYFEHLDNAAVLQSHLGE